MDTLVETLIDTNTLVDTSIQYEQVLRFERIIDMKQALGKTGFKKSIDLGWKAIYNRVNDADIQVEHKLCYGPFWHIKCDVYYEYDRICSHDVDILTPEVDSLTIGNEIFYVTKGNQRKFTISGKEHCKTQGMKDIIYDAQSGQQYDVQSGQYKNWMKYREYKKEAEVIPNVQSGKLQDWMECLKDKAELLKNDPKYLNEDIIFLQPRMSLKALVYKVFQELPTPINANSIRRGTANIEFLELFFRPVHVFSYIWEQGGVTKEIAVDGMTGEKINYEETLHKRITETMTSELLFDVSEEAADLMLPGSRIVFRFIKAFNNEK